MFIVKQLKEFTDWLDSRKDSMTRIRLAKRLDKAQRGLLGDIAPVGEGVFEMRESFWSWLAHVLRATRRCVDRDAWGRRQIHPAG